MEAEGSKRAAITGIYDRRQITAVLNVTMSGHFLSPQIVYKGTTRRSLPAVKFPEGSEKSPGFKPGTSTPIYPSPLLLCQRSLLSVVNSLNFYLINKSSGLVQLIHLLVKF